MGSVVVELRSLLLSSFSPVDALEIGVFWRTQGIDLPPIRRLLTRRHFEQSRLYIALSSIIHMESLSLAASCDLVIRLRIHSSTNYAFVAQTQGTLGEHELRLMPEDAAIGSPIDLRMLIWRSQEAERAESSPSVTWYDDIASRHPTHRRKQRIESYIFNACYNSCRKHVHTSLSAESRAELVQLLEQPHDFDPLLPLLVLFGGCLSDQDVYKPSANHLILIFVV